VSPDIEHHELRMTFDGMVPTVSDAEVLLIESFLGDVLQAMLQQDEER
jgi:hypothetical protein